jgi:hypothetical protein
MLYWAVTNSCDDFLFGEPYVQQLWLGGRYATHRFLGNYLFFVRDHDRDTTGMP